MAKILFSQYRHNDLHNLVNKLDKDYYSVLSTLCQTAELLIDELEGMEPQQSTLLYLSLSKKLLSQVNELVMQRIGMLLPYAQELHSKETSGHDCSTCEGGCHIKHSSQLIGLKESHHKIKEILFRLHTVALPLYTDVDYPSQYKTLRNEMMLIDTALTELFYLEEASLIPKIMEAQKNIHAYN
jgi:hypothetical protein